MKIWFSDGLYIIDGKKFKTACKAYEEFRRMYNINLGKSNYAKFGHKGLRTERLKSCQVQFPKWYSDIIEKEFADHKPIKSWMLGITGGAYVRISGNDGFSDDYQNMDYSKAIRFIDWVMSGKGRMKLYGRRDKILKTGKQDYFKNKKRKYYGRNKKERGAAKPDCLKTTGEETVSEA